MIWASVSSRSCFCWLYIVSPSLAANNKTIWLRFWPSGDVYVKGPLVLLEESICYDQCILLTKLLALCFILYSKAKFAYYPGCFLTSYFCIPVPYNEKNVYFWMLVLKGLVGIHRTIQLQLLLHYWSGHRLELLWYWMICLWKEQRSFCHFWDCIQVLHLGLFCWLW